MDNKKLTSRYSGRDIHGEVRHDINVLNSHQFQLVVYVQKTVRAEGTVPYRENCIPPACICYHSQHHGAEVQVYLNQSSKSLIY